MEAASNNPVFSLAPAFVSSRVATHKLSKTESGSSIKHLTASGQKYMAGFAKRCAHPCVDSNQASQSSWPHRHIKSVEKVQELVYLFRLSCIKVITSLC